MQTIDFQKVLEKFKTKATFLKLLNSVTPESDTAIYLIMTNLGKMAVLEIDVIISWEHLQSIYADQGIEPNFVKAKSRLDFESSLPVQKSSVYKKPADWGVMSNYAADGCGSRDCYFVFLAKVVS